MSHPVHPGKTALVTGGASGIGLGIARVLLDAGLHVIVADVRADHLETARAALAEAGDRALFLSLDVGNRDDWQRARETVEERYGRLHILCLNAGVGLLGSMIDSDEADWMWSTIVNLAGVTNGVDALLPHMLAHGEPGHVIATSSMGGLIVANDGGIYSSAKFGVVALMEELRRALAGTSVSASVLCPAAVNTNIFDHVRMRPEAFAAKSVPDERMLEEAEAFARGILSHGRSPLEVGEMVRAAIAADAPYVFTDSAVRPTLAARYNALLASVGA
ncbi:SDR family oxidoreductase [Sphingomonas mali]|uniref:SDR family oxidoreductase n=1 Tax=Sphingomonas mali TaxID=40682 RepID=UPI000AB51051|nr:SDR family NAD(P)-dependent oxidoreductase [Sphingomonas mali]